MGYNSDRPLGSYTPLEIVRRGVCTALYYGIYLGLYLIYFKPRALLGRRRHEPAADLRAFQKYADYYFPRPDFAFFKADEGRCFRDQAAHIVSPSLEIGYEDGRIAAYHTDNHRFDVGLEYDPAVAGKTPLFAHYGRLLQGRFEAIPFPNASFRTVMAIHVLDHITALEPSLKETARVLQPKGHFLFSLHSHLTPKVISRRMLASFDLHNFLSEAEWRRLLLRHGMELVVFREFTCTTLYLRMYFLGLHGLIPHDRSRVFSLLQRTSPTAFRVIKAVLRDITECIYLDAFLAPASSRQGRGLNAFILARKI